MHKALKTFVPTVTNMIRADHTHVLATFHQYEIDTSPGTKRALVSTICAGLEIHAQLEEEIFYPAMREVAGDAGVVGKGVPEHDEMRRLIARLREMEPDDAGYDATVMELMRDVIHHVADEETILLPDAERVLADRLEELGGAMTKRRLELVAPRTLEIAWNQARALPASNVLMGAGALALVVMLLGGLRRKSRFRVSRAMA
ncbi:MAG TPA: hemerythrin domain-containing protein [Caldimonas sp.]|nr:hemerythrin domain-containing protein [Caldimonas sp.]